MANYIATARTNYFRVTDEERYAELFAGLLSEDQIYDFTKTDSDGVTRHCFGSYDAIDWYAEEDEDHEDPDFGRFLIELQRILPEDEAFMYFEAGHEKLRYVTGCTVVVTANRIRRMSIDDWAMKTAEELLGEGFTTQIDY